MSVCCEANGVMCTYISNNHWKRYIMTSLLPSVDINKYDIGLQNAPLPSPQITFTDWFYKNLDQGLFTFQVVGTVNSSHTVVVNTFGREWLPQPVNLACYSVTWNHNFTDKMPFVLAYKTKPLIRSLFTKRKSHSSIVQIKSAFGKHELPAAVAFGSIRNNSNASSFCHSGLMSPVSLWETTSFSGEEHMPLVHGFRSRWEKKNEFLRGKIQAIKQLLGFLKTQKNVDLNQINQTGKLLVFCRFWKKKDHSF